MKASVDSGIDAVYVTTDTLPNLSKPQILEQELINRSGINVKR